MIKKSKFKVATLLLLFCLCLSLPHNAQSGPTFNSGQDPKPSDQKWVKVDNMSDEFDGSNLTSWKWQNTDDSKWVGRPPGRFKTYSVSQSGGYLKITNSLLPSPEFRTTWDGVNQKFTHAGGMLISKYAGQVGDYFECSMRANKTFMSSTFWLINDKKDTSGCDKRTTELDIQECVGIATDGPGSQYDYFTYSMVSNTHSRDVACSGTTPTGSAGDKRWAGGQVSARHYVYGAWWKSPTEIVFFLDGQERYTIRPKANFNLPLYLRLVNETYDWNKPPAGGGMNGSFDDRTTTYEWVRTWRLQDNGSSGGGGSANTGAFFIQNRATNKLIRPITSDEGGAVAQAPASWKGNWTRWKSIDAGNGYFHIQNVQTGKFLRPASTDNNSGFIQSHTGVNWQWQTQWKKINASDGYFYLQNRWSGKYFRPISNDDLGASTGNNYGLQLVPTSLTWHFTQWKFNAVFSSKSGSKSSQNSELETLAVDGFEPLANTFHFYPNPASTSLNIKVGNNDCSFSIFDLSGRLVKSVQASKNSVSTVSLSDFSKGVYMIQYNFINGKEIFTEKLIVK